ncbi:hypothetical protein MD484_g506, partial [Candolleomyces efflorescens]
MSRPRAHLHPALYVATELLALVGYATRPNSLRIRWLFFLTVAAICIYFIFYTSTGDISSDYSFGGAISALFFTASDFLVLNPNVQKEFKPIPTKLKSQIPKEKVRADLKEDDSEEDISKAEWKRRFYWALKLRFNPRGIGWTHEAPLPNRADSQNASTKKNTSQTRTSFVMRRLFEGVLNAIILDLCTVAAKRNPTFVKGRPELLLEASWTWRTVSVFQFVGMTYCGLRMMHSVLSAAFVGTKISNPEDWPPLFGKLGEAYTVRRFWGKFWHQLLRRFLTAHADFITYRIFQLRRQTIPATSLKFFFAFFFSGLSHYASDCMILNNWSGGAMCTFVIQAFAIGAEALVNMVSERFGRQIVPNAFTKLLGYVWVVWWVGYSWAFWIAPVVASGYLEAREDIGIIRGLLDVIYGAKLKN